MAKVIEFYVPARHHPEGRWIPEAARGKLLAFPAAQRKAFVQLADSALWPLPSWPAPKTWSAAGKRRPPVWTAK